MEKDWIILCQITHISKLSCLCFFSEETLYNINYDFIKML